jgi:hypothetical protein
MTITDKIHASVQQLPTAYQAEVLAVVEYLLTKAPRGAPEQEESPWSDVSLTMAMCGMADEDAPQDTTADLQVIFS